MLHHQFFLYGVTNESHIILKELFFADNYHLNAL